MGNEWRARVRRVFQDFEAGDESDDGERETVTYKSRLGKELGLMIKTLNLVKLSTSFHLKCVAHILRHCILWMNAKVISVHLMNYCRGWML